MMILLGGPFLGLRAFRTGLVVLMMVPMTLEFLGIGMILLVVILVIEGIEVKIRHQFGLHIVNGFSQSIQEFVEILLVQEDLMAVITIIVEPFFAFGNREEIIISTGGFDIEKIGPSFSSLQPLGENTVIITLLLISIFVRHVGKF